MVEEILTECPKCGERGYVPADQAEATCNTCGLVYACATVKEKRPSRRLWIISASVAFVLIIAALAWYGTSEKAINALACFGAFLYLFASFALLILVLMWICLPWLIMRRMQTMIQQNERIIGLLRKD